MGEEERVVVGNAHRSALIWRGPFEHSAEFEELVTTLRFSETPK